MIMKCYMVGVAELNVILKTRLLIIEDENGFSLYIDWSRNRFQSEIFFLETSGGLWSKRPWVINLPLR